MKFTYKRFSNGACRPIIPFEVSNGKKSVRYLALVDSGSDLCVFHKEIADILDIDIEKGKKAHVSGVTEGEKQSYYIHPVTLSFGGLKHTADVGFMANLSKSGHGILGQYGFFDKYKVSFNLLEEEIEITSHAS